MVKLKDVNAQAVADARKFVEKHFGDKANEVKVNQKAIDIVVESSSHEYSQLKQAAKAWIGDHLRRVKGLNTKEKTLLSGTNSAGGHLVPEEFDRAMRFAPTPQYPVRNLVDSTPMSGNTKEVPVQTGGPTVAWVAEEAVIAESTPTYGNVTLTAYKASSLVKSSSEFLEDEDVSPDAIEKLYQDFVDRLAEHEEKFIVGGSGSSQPHGLKTEFKSSGSDFAITSTADTLNTMTYANVRAFLRSLPKVYQAGGVISMDSDTVTLIAALNDGSAGSNRAFFDKFDANRNVPDGADGVLLGYPVYYNTENFGKTNTIGGTITAAKAGAIMFWSPAAAYIVGQRSGTRIETGLNTDDFSKDRISHRAVKRFAGNVVKGLQSKPVAVLAYRATT